MEVLSGRILLRPKNLARTQRFYREVLGLAVAREFGPEGFPGVVFHLGGGFLEVSGEAPRGPANGGRPGVQIWMQVRNVDIEHDRLLKAGVEILREPLTERWGLREMWIVDPDGVKIVLVQIPADHPLRRDTRAP